MEKLTIDEIVNAVKGDLVVKGESTNFLNVNTDTRKLKNGDVFLALKGENFNANDFVEEASHKKASICVVSEIKYNIDNLAKETSVILVEDTNKALLDLAEYYRTKLNLKIIAITGSTGKTSTKDLVAASLSEKYKVFKTKGNFNNEIGMPLMLLSLDNSYDVAVLEMGMSNLLEIHRLAKTAKPDMAIITNIGISHIENLKTKENILKAKMEVTDFFSKNNCLIINNDDEYLNSIKDEEFQVIKIGIDSNSNYKAKNIILKENGLEYDLYCSENKMNSKVKINMLGRHNVYNSLLAVACAKELGLQYDEILRGLNNIEATSMRLDIIKGKFTIVNDCYNASPDSMKAAIDVISNIKMGRKIAILGTMRELGHMSYKAHLDVAKYAKLKKIDGLYTLGEYNEAFNEGFGEENYKAFESQEQLVDYVKDVIKSEDVVLVKASRYMKFENIVENLKKINN
ncbi:UDP-N-acetylmuramoyl-tripeptide--D-alanyl-D-alanine ligase [Haloimpatiens sp. FM7315]|uniref:UDP-N-acetylmuramoyl-tripeptide--D-alanyl-D- alanine ligase n=1 Tax=Haloimpatiens sp. FM7315 TaxID=3298609 RepID=UPI00370A09E6